METWPICPGEKKKNIKKRGKGGEDRRNTEEERK
jgi:hypothetical protein